MQPALNALINTGTVFNHVDTELWNKVNNQSMRSVHVFELCHITLKAETQRRQQKITLDNLKSNWEMAADCWYRLMKLLELSGWCL